VVLREIAFLLEPREYKAAGAFGNPHAAADVCIAKPAGRLHDHFKNSESPFERIGRVCHVCRPPAFD
jgi:hypothetical protein